MKSPNEHFNKVNQSINPEKTSYLTLEDGEKFEKIIQRPQVQYLVSNLIRGTINSAQVIPKPKFDKKGKLLDVEYFSHYQNLEKIEAKKDPNSTMIEASVDIFLLRYTFSDGDKIIFLDKSMAGLSKHYPGAFEHSNIITNEHSEEEKNTGRDFFKFTKNYFFDFGRAFSPANCFYRDIPSQDEKEALIYSLLDMERTYMDSASEVEKDEIKTFFTILNKKSEQLLSHTFSDYRVFEEILGKGFVDLTGGDFSMFFNANFGHMANMTKEEAGQLMFNELKERLEFMRDTTASILSNISKSQEE